MASRKSDIHRRHERERKRKNAPLLITNLYDPSVRLVIRPSKTRPQAAQVRRNRKRFQLRALGVNSYEEYLRSDRWLSKRRELEESGRPLVCVSCGKRRNLHTHHRTYERLGEELLSDLDLLCERCHQLAHQAAKKLAGVTLWNCSREVARLIALGFETDRFDERAWNQYHTKGSKIAQAKRRSLAEQRRASYARSHGGKAKA